MTAWMLSQCLACKDSDELTPCSLSAAAGADIRAGAGVTTVGLSADMPPSGVTGVWTVINGGGGSFSDAHSATSTFTGQVATAYTLRWTVSTEGDCSAADDIAVTLSPCALTADAGDDVETRHETIVLAASALQNEQTGRWSVISGDGGALQNADRPNATFTGIPGTTYTLRWTVTNGSCEMSDDLAIKITTLKVSSVDIRYAPAGGLVTINGTGFDDHPTVFLDNTPVTVVSSSETQLQIEVSGEPGEYTLAVENGDGSRSTLPGTFLVLAPSSITQLDPKFGPHGHWIRAMAVNAYSNNPTETSVRFIRQNTMVTAETYSSNRNSVEAIIPDLHPDEYDIVTISGGKPMLSPEKCTITEKVPVVVTSITPAVVNVGDMLTVKGSGFSNYTMNAYFRSSTGVVNYIFIVERKPDQCVFMVSILPPGEYQVGFDLLKTPGVYDIEYSPIRFTVR